MLKALLSGAGRCSLDDEVYKMAAVEGRRSLVSTFAGH